MNAFTPPGRAGPAVTPEDFTHAMGAAVTGVTVVTTDGPAGRFGLTVSSLASVSAEPPLLLVCIQRRNPAMAAISQNQRFAVNVLGADQSDVARIFAGRPLDGTAYDFSRHVWRMGHAGLPLLAAAAAHFECDVDSQHDAGTHRIFIGRVVTAARLEAPALVYSRRAYGRMVPLEPQS